MAMKRCMCNKLHTSLADSSCSQQKHRQLAWWGLYAEAVAPQRCVNIELQYMGDACMQHFKHNLL